jgi:hypothetical protein
MKDFLLNVPGWRSKRQLVVIESDDWGSLRMPSREVLKELQKNSYINVSDPYNENDNLESEEDLQALFGILRKYKDKNGNHPVITANCVQANPDFCKIKKHNFQKYFYEPLEKTFKTHGKLSSLNLWHEGLKEGIFYPQFHGREHLNVPLWMEKLQDRHPGVREAFDMGVFGPSFKNLGLRKNNFQAAWDFYTPEQEESIAQTIKEGLNLFEKRFGFKSKSLIAPSYTWSKSQEAIFAAGGVRYLQTIRMNKIPKEGEIKYKRALRFTGKKTSQGLINLVRIAFFEPTIFNHQKQVEEVLRRVKIAFRCGKPAIISSHRLNFIGSLVPENRTKTLQQFDVLLRTLIKEWPDVEFLSSEKLGEIVSQKM